MENSTGIAIFGVASFLCSVIVVWFSFREHKKQESDKLKTDALMNSIDTATQKIGSLTSLNNKLIANASSVIANTDSLSTKMEQVQTIHDQILRETRETVAKSEEIIDNINRATKKMMGLTAVTGHLDIGYAYPFENSQKVAIAFGSRRIVDLAAMFQRNEHPLSPGRYNSAIAPFTVNISSGRLQISSITVFDMDQNWLARVNENNWERNPAVPHRFNFDDLGFEILDKSGNVVLSIDLVAPDIIEIQGYFFNSKFYQTESYLMVSGKLSNRRIERNEFFGPDGVTPKQNIDFYNVIKREQTMAGVSPLFKYEGSDWFSRRAQPTVQFSAKVNICGENREVVFRGETFERLQMTFIRGTPDLKYEVQTNIIRVPSDWKVELSLTDPCVMHAQVEILKVVKEHFEKMQSQRQ